MIVVDPNASRRYNMSRIKSKDTKPEVLVRKFLFSRGFRYLKNDKRYPGKPDIVLPRYRTVIFVNGCFWHGHDRCSNYSIPKSNTDYWIPKLERNHLRDLEHVKALQADGWQVITIWECELKKAVRDERLASLCQQIRHLDKYAIE